MRDENDMSNLISSNLEEHGGGLRKKGNKPKIEVVVCQIFVKSKCAEYELLPVGCIQVN